MEIKCRAGTEGKGHTEMAPYVDSSHIQSARHYVKCQEMLAERSLIWLSPEWHCQSLSNTEADTLSQPLD